MTIATFYADLRTAIGRGSSIDASLPGWCQEAINFLENQHTYQWMKKTNLFPLVPGATSNTIALGTSRIKAVDWVKFGKVDGTGSQTQTTFGDTLKLVDPQRITSFDSGYAGAYYFDGVDTIVLDARPQEAASLYLRYFEFTAWPTDTSQTPPVLARHYHGFKAHTMMTIAANLRDDRLGQIWTGVSQQGLQAMLAADAEMEWHAQRQLRAGG